MRLSVKTLAAMLMVSALTAFQFETDAQSRTGSRPSSTSRSTTSGSYKRSSDKGSTKAVRPESKPKADKPAPSRPKADVSPADRTRKPSANKPSGNKPSPNQPSVNRPPANKPTANRPVTRPPHHPVAGRPSVNRPPAPRPNNPKPVVHRPIRHHKPSYHWLPDNHYYGHRIKSLPLRAVRHYYNGVTYYHYNNIWYRPYNGYYVVSRPPFGTLVAANLIADLALTAVKISYYNSMIKVNNAASYYYQDGVYYTPTTDGQYMVTAPPVGALVEVLPSDYEEVVLSDGQTYYNVDGILYKTTVSDGKPYFEVVGQM